MYKKSLTPFANICYILNIVMLRSIIAYQDS